MAHLFTHLLNIFQIWPEILELLAYTSTSEDETDPCSSQNYLNLANEFHSNLQLLDDCADVQLSDINHWINSNPLLMGDECLNDEEIVQIIREQNSDMPEDRCQDGKENEAENEAKDEQENTLIHELSEAQEHLEKVITFCEKNPHYTKGNLVGLYEVKDAMVSHILMAKPD